MRRALPLVVLLLALPAAAQTDVVTTITADDVGALAREVAAEFDVPLLATTERMPDSTFAVAAGLVFAGEGGAPADALRFFVSLDDCADVACSALSGVAYFGTGGAGPGLGGVNAWNAGHRYTRAYLDGDGVALQSDLDLRGGVTRGAVRTFLQTYLLSLVSFADALSGAPAPTPAPAPAGQ